MEKLDNVKYEKLNMLNYKKRLADLEKNEKLKRLGFKREKVASTFYGYDIDLLSVGYGEKEIFIVGGTHSSEIIAVDFVTQLVEKLPDFKEFDPNLFTIKIIPLQNPEGFDINTSVTDHIDESEFEKKSKEFYIKYKTDSIIYSVFNYLNVIKDNEDFVSLFQTFMENNIWKSLHITMPNIVILENEIRKIDKNDPIKSIKILNACNETKLKLNLNNFNDILLYDFINKLNKFFENKEKRDLKKEEKLYQKMFEKVEVSRLKIRNLSMRDSISEVYKNNPLGSIINHDTNGQFINLNSNQPNNKGIDAIKNKDKIFMKFAKSNLQNYSLGPVGVPTLDVNNFEFSIENQVLYSLINDSYEKGKYVATLLYHGTGGMIYYKPNKDALDEEKYNYFLNYNTELADVYNQGIEEYRNFDYKKQNDEDDNGFGDYLRKNFPGVLLIELSKMNGNPIAPYGDKNNIYNTINENLSAVKSLLKFEKEKLEKKGKKY